MTNIVRIVFSLVLALVMGAPVSAQTEDDKKLFQEYLQLKAHAGNSPNECGPKSDGSGTIVGHIALPTQSNIPTVIRIFAAGPGADAYLGTLSGKFMPSNLSSVSADAMIVLLREQQQRMALVSALYASMRNARPDDRGHFTCKGLAAGRYVLMYQAVSMSATATNGLKTATSRYYTAEALLPKERPGYRYVATSSAFQLLRP